MSITHLPALENTPFHSFLISGIIPEIGEISRVLFEILSLSRVTLSRVSSRPKNCISRLSRLSRVLSEIRILSRVTLSRVSKPNHAHFLFQHPKCSYQSDFGQKDGKSAPADRIFTPNPIILSDFRKSDKSPKILPNRPQILKNPIILPKNPIILIKKSDNSQKI